MGRDGSMFTHVLKNVVEKSRLRARDLLVQAYQTDSGIFNHIEHASTLHTVPPEQQRPMIADEIHPAEDLSACHPYKSVMNRYIDAKVYDYFKITLPEMLNMSHYMIEQILEVCSERLSADLQRQKNTMDELSKAQGKR
jgi:hypothetical protein